MAMAKKPLVITKDDDFVADAPAAAAPPRAPVVITDEGGFQPDGQSAAPAKAPQKTTGTEAFVSHAGNSALGGFTDELVGAIGGAAAKLGLTKHLARLVGAGELDEATAQRMEGQSFGENYREGRDATREQLREGAQEHRGAAIAGDIAGGVASSAVPGLGVAKAGTKLAAAGRLAAQGAVYGAGASEADLTKGDVGGVARDAALGAGTSVVLGGAAAGAGKLVGKAVDRIRGGAERRLESRAVNSLFEGTPARTVQDPAIAKLGGRQEVAKVLKTEGLEKTLRKGPGNVAEEVGKRLDEVGEKLGKYYDRVTEADGGVSIEDSVIPALRRVQEKARARSDGAAFEAVETEISRLRRMRPAPEPVPTEPVRFPAHSEGQQMELPMPGAAEIKRIRHGAGGRFERAEPIPGYPAVDGPGPYQQSLFPGGGAPPPTMPGPPLTVRPDVMNARELHSYVQTLGGKGFAANIMHPSAASQLQRDIRREMLGVLQQHVDDVTRANPEIGSLAELRKLNDRYGKLHAIADVAEAKAERLERVSPTLGQRAMQVVQRGADVGAVGSMLGAVATGHPSLALAGAGAAAAARLAPHVAPAIDVGALKVASYLRSAGNLQELTRRAAIAGVPREAAIALVQRYGFEAPTAEPPPAPPPTPLLSGM